MEVEENKKMKFPLNRQELMWCIIIFMLGVNMYWSAFIIDPILQIIDNQHKLALVAVTQNERIIDILTNGTDITTTELLVETLNLNTTQ